MSGRFVRSVCTAALVAGAASVALQAPPASAAPADPPDQPVSALLARLQALYRKAETATETYNATEEKLKGQRKETARLNGDLTRARGALTDSRDDAGRIAREQYRAADGAFSPFLGFLLSPDPRLAFDRSHQITRAAGHRAATVHRLTHDERRAEELAARARKALDAQQKLAARQKKQRDTINDSLAQVEKLLASLSAQQLAELRGLERRTAGEAQHTLLSSGRLSGARAPSRAGGRALAYAYAQLGKPYVWGSAGPDSFDCSGLTSQAWAHAGDLIPRTSQEQWRTLPRVSLDRLRPGDLVIYFEDATHVALYIGDGLVIQAPRPGTAVKISPIASNPLLGAVRPDAGEAPLRDYVPPLPPPPGSSALPSSVAVALDAAATPAT
ncbi:C40 family peptidase [Streptomyces eurocidicus]|uniref:C40 family peptidase n=1 Tax=Streptomyces eurocidicus TaxID=66423 RepID=UPI00268D36AC